MSEVPLYEKPHGLAEREGENSNGFKNGSYRKWLKPGLGWVICSKLARQRCGGRREGQPGLDSKF